MARRKKKGYGKGCLMVFALPFAGVGMFMLYLTLATLTQSFRASRWDVTPCEILSVDLKVNRGSDSTTYRCVAQYRYTVAGQSYRSDRVSFSKGSDNVGSYHHDCKQAIDVGRRNGSMVCYVDPSDPAEAVLFPGVRWGMICFYMVFVLAFGGFGIGMLFAGGWAQRREQKVSRARAANPEAPWLWRPEWQSRVIKASDKAGAIGASIFAGFWNVIAFPVGIMAFMDGYLKDGNKAALVALLFPVVGIGLMAWAVYAVLKYRKYGRTTFELASVPGVLGGKLAGIIHVPVHVVAEDGFHLRLVCIHKYTTGSGKHRTTHEDVLWEDTRVLERELLADDRTRTALPVLFALPYNAQESSRHDGNDRHEWRLEASARTPGIDFKTRFEVPVFKTAESHPDFVLDDAVVQPYEKEITPDDTLRKHRVSAEPTAGGMRYRFPAARHIGHGLGLGIGCAIWTGFIVGMVLLKAPLLFPVVFGFFGLFLIWGVIDLWLVASTVEITHSTVTVTRGIFGIAPPRIVPRAEVVSVKVTQGMRSGQTQFFTLKLVTKAGKTFTLGNNLVGRRDAESLADRMWADMREHAA